MDRDNLDQVTAHVARGIPPPTRTIFLPPQQMSLPFNGNEIEDDPSRIEREHLSLRTQLYSSITLQIDRTRSSLHALNDSTSVVSNVHTTIGRITDLCLQADKLFDNFPFIKTVSRAAENFAECRKVYEQFKGLNDQVAFADDLLKQVVSKEALQLSPPALLLLHYKLSKLEEFRRSTMAMAEGSAQSLQFTLKRYFRRLDDLSAAFDAFFWSLDIEELMDNPGLVIAVIKIVTKMSDGSARSRLLNKLEQSVMSKFEGVKGEDASDMLDSLKFYEGALLDIRNKYVTCFPPDWHIMDFYLSAYHRGICKVLATIAFNPPSTPTAAAKAAPSKDKDKSKSQQPPPAMFTRLDTVQLLHMMRWIRQYIEFLSQFAVTLESLSPKILEGRQDGLISDYVKLSGGMIANWVDNLRDAEEKNFRERAHCPRWTQTITTSPRRPLTCFKLSSSTSPQRWMPIRGDCPWRYQGVL